MLNNCIFEGRLIKDPESRRLPSGLTTVTVTIGVDRSIKKEGKPALYLPCNFFGKQAELIAKSFQKGNAIIVSGRLENDVLETVDGFEKKTFFYLNGQSFEYPATRAEPQKAQQPQPQAGAPTQSASASTPARTVQKPYGGESYSDEFVGMNEGLVPIEDVVDDDLPF